MRSVPRAPEKRTEIEELERALGQAIAAEISELAEDLATTDDAHLFGADEFKIRSIAHRIAAKAVERGAPAPDEPADLGERLLALVAEAVADGVDPEQALRDAVRRNA